MPKDQPLHHHPSTGTRRSVRIQGRSYNAPGAYYVTICTYRRALILGDVVHTPAGDATVHLTHIGGIVDACWRGIPTHWPHARLDAYVIMPNHLHGIILLHPTADPEHALSAETFGCPVPGSLATLVRSFKAACTRDARRSLADPTLRLWQRGYHERVIFDHAQWDQIRGYIQTNPLHWADPARREDY